MFRFICETVNLFTIQNYFYLGKIQAYLEDDHLRDAWKWLTRLVVGWFITSLVGGLILVFTVSFYVIK